MANEQPTDFSFLKHYRLNELTGDELRAIYPHIAARRQNFENLLWQVPMLSLTGESFLFTIILGESSTFFSRLISSSLAMVIALTSLSSLARHRLSETHDSQLISAIEEVLFKKSFHGLGFRDSRKEFFHSKKSLQRADFWDFLVKILSKGRAYPIWMFVFTCFFVAAFTSFLLNFIDPAVFSI